MKTGKDDLSLMLIATRTTPDQARAHYEAGGRVLVSDSGLEEIPVGENTTTHSLRNGMSWADLEHAVNNWDNPYPYTQYYLVPDAI